MSLVSGGPVRLDLADEATTGRLGEDIAAILAPGDAILLSGDLGMGKTTLARAIIRALAGDAGLEVPSPTFTIVQPYAGRVPVHHFDLYRLASADELEELGLREALEEGVALVEWPERAASALPADAVRLTLSEAGDGRDAEIDGPAAFLARRCGADRIGRIRPRPRRRDRRAGRFSRKAAALARHPRLPRRLGLRKRDAQLPHRRRFRPRLRDRHRLRPDAGDPDGCAAPARRPADPRRPAL
jgi:tRNA threonylcarbamoyl adenosine modification protein YjeE